MKRIYTFHKNHLLPLLLIASCMCCPAHAQFISTIAGNGSAGFSGDSSRAINATLQGPFGVAVDGAGNVFFCDRGNNRVRKIDIAGTITTVAGNGNPSFSGDNYPARSAAINNITGVAADGSGNLYIADKGNNRIRKVGTDGIITTIAGNGIAGFSGDGGPATLAELNFPRGLAIDKVGNIFIADQVNCRVRKVDVNGIITTIAGNGIFGFSGDGGPATDASFNSPYAVATDNDGNLYIADVDNERIRKVDASGIITTFAGNSYYGYHGDYVPATNTTLYEPIGVAADKYGNVFIADGWNNRIRAVGKDGMITTVAGCDSFGYNGDGGIAVLTELFHPYGIAVNSSGDLYIGDNSNNRVRCVKQPVNNFLSTQEIYLFPNPNTGSFIVKLPSIEDSNAQMKLFDAAGKTIWQRAVQTNSIYIKVQDELPPGVYFFKITGKGLEWVKKIEVVGK
jgi:sugar lactone lactonase YvrE